MKTLLLEIGTEEIPAGYIEPALKELASKLLKKMTDARIDHGETRTFGTPKRLAIEVLNVSEKQESLSTEVSGPPERIGFDENGKPTIAAEKFAEKIGISVSKISVKETKKGRYLCATQTERGLASKVVLQKILPEIILSIPFPKTMRWADLDVHFARPIKSILALLGENVISFSVANLKSNRFTFGHRFTHPKRIKTIAPENYLPNLEAADVIADIGQRMAMIKSEIQKTAQNLDGRVLPDDDLLGTVTNLVEFPAVCAGKFDDKFLKLPKEVLITSMRVHQKYFAVIDSKGDLKPCFIVVNNTPANDMQLVARGHERVLRARLEDAIFFYNNDLKISLESNVEKLKRVLFQAKLGSIHEKILRVRQLAEFVSDSVEKNSDLKRDVSRAAWLCKADLVSQVVVEFPKLQGIMGRVYALKSGESENVAKAIEEHYRPVYSGAPLPETKAGALLSISEKMDTICGCFSIGLSPTGASDPYALRRQGIGIIQILQNKGFTFSLNELIKKSVELYGEKDSSTIKEITGNVYTFLQSRITHLLAEKGFSKDVIASVVSVSVDNIPDVLNRVDALEYLKTQSDFELLAIAFKRIINIIKKADLPKDLNVDENQFEDKCESDLRSAYLSVQKSVNNHLETGAFDKALLDIASLGNTVDAFFDGVMVMAEDFNVRNNRLALLSDIASLFENIADFSKIST